MGTKFILDLGQPYEVVVPVSLPEGKEQKTVTATVLFNHVSSADLSDCVSNEMVLYKVLHSVKKCQFKVLDIDGNEVLGEQLRSVFIANTFTQNALISAWTEASKKNNYRVA